MRKGALLLVLLLLFLVVFSLILQSVKGKIGRDFTRGLPRVSDPVVTTGPSVAQEKVTRSLFVPYWTVSNAQIDTSGYDTVIYFGITPTLEGIDENEMGYKKLALFQQHVRSSDRLLTLRMLDRETNLAILKSKDAQEAIIEETIILAKDYGFSGVVLDLELSALPFDSLLRQVTEFSSNFSQSIKENDLSFAMTLYGDTFYRLRPFDVKALEKNVPSFLIMAYDFHKAAGNPGPNFPLSGKDTYGYDYQTMLTSFLQYIPPAKLGIIYGMYGYDWEINSSGKAVTSAKARSYQEIEKNIIARCSELECKREKDMQSTEMKITYTDTENKKHVIWFEDQESVKKKEALAKKMGIGTFSFWAYSYF
ncbi:MAG: hypothetical protein HYV40_03950 [Candidatus Levybacteria bacterium]|nr:hypothetical protein [Candidatus Levybacteria bacterium]